MAGVLPLFVTGAKAKIKLDGLTLAFCTDLSYSVSVPTADPHILGMYEASSIEPLSYSVRGSFSLLRYTRAAMQRQKRLLDAGMKGESVPGANPDGNGVGNWGKTSTSVFGTNGNSGLLTSLTSQDPSNFAGRSYDALNPKAMSYAASFVIEAYQMSPAAAGLEADDLPIARLRNVRISSADMTLDRRTISNQRFNFVARYADEDSFVAESSFVGEGGG